MDVEAEVKISLSLLDLPKETKTIKVTELWPEEKKSQSLTIEELSDFQFTILADLQPGGGLHVVRFELD
jgi:hypothetical protein